jgi:hypothetical protein
VRDLNEGLVSTSKKYLRQAIVPALFALLGLLVGFYSIWPVSDHGRDVSAETFQEQVLD